MNIETFGSKREHDTPPSVAMVIKIRKLALRRHVWFKYLNRVERGVIDLTVSYVDSIKSVKLAKVVTAILEKLQQTTESTVVRMAKTLGISMARKVSNIALNWGNNTASAWIHDPTFARYLILNQLFKWRG